MMKKLIIIVLSVLVSVLTINAQGIKKNENFFKKNKIEPVLGMGAGFNQEGNNTDFFLGINLDKEFSFYVGGMMLVNYNQNFNSQTSLKNSQQISQLTTGMRGYFVKAFLNITALADYESKIIAGISISLVNLSIYYNADGLNEDVKSSSIIPAAEVGYELSWSRITANLKYVPYENVHHKGASKIYFGANFIIPFGMKPHKDKWGY